MLGIDQNSSDILKDFSPRLLIYKNGSVERLGKDVIVPASYDPKTCIHSKDVNISPGVSARIYRPDNIPGNAKIPLLIYIHGGAFCQFSAYSQMYHTYLNSLVHEANVIAVSVEYRLAPEYPIPTCYDDTWAVTEWVLSHSHSVPSGPDPWISQWADMGRVFIAGDSAGATMSHNMMARAEQSGLLGPASATIEGAALVHPFFVGGEEKLDEIAEFLSEGRWGPSDPRFNPESDADRMRKEVVCKRMLIIVDKDDMLREKGVSYYETLTGSGWKGQVRLLETNGGGHVFHLVNPHLEKSQELVKVMAQFINNK